MDFLKLVREARTCRRFIEARPLSTDDLKWLIECARLTPNARNAQELRYILINSPLMCEELDKKVKWAAALKDWRGPGPGERPVAFIAILMPKNSTSLSCFNVGIAAQTIQLAATSRGWGACIIYSFERSGMAEILSVPRDMEIALLIATGVAEEKRVIAEMPENGDFNYWRDDAGTHYVPKRSVGELIIREF